MKTKFDLTNAQAVVDEYCTSLADPTQIPGRIGRTWIETRLEKHGVIPDMRGLGFMESHAIWYACLIVTGSVRRVSKLERTLLPGRTTHRGVSTESTIRKMLDRVWPAGTGVAASYLHEILDKVGHKTAA